MADTRRKTGPTPKRRAAQAARRRPVTRYPWDLPETPAQRASIVSQQGGGRERAAALFGDPRGVATAREFFRRLRAKLGEPSS